jgi:lipopolysaccharide transport system ATP-binding protein
MSKIAISVNKLGKRYRIGGQRASYKTIRESIIAAAGKPLRWMRGERQIANNSFWALNDVSFEVNHGDVIGIIGRNGAGKSTLLKILSRITKPTTGRVELHGRVGSLLEVGTGFHPELTGRENIFLNGAILGMKRVEINRKFDEIVSFSEVEKFLDTPVKYYSSGMYVRLAFAVAAHMEPEILLVDEVLAVGDIAFQNKCLRKMGDVANEGRTILFISHNMAAIESLCQKGVVLDNGCVDFVGTQTEAIAKYFENFREKKTSLQDYEQRSGNGMLRIVGVEFQDIDGHRLEVIQSGQTIDVCFSYEAAPDYVNGYVHVGLQIYTQLGIQVFSQTTRIMGSGFVKVPPAGVFICRIPHIPLPAALYQLNCGIKVNEIKADDVVGAITMMVAEGDFYGSGRVPLSNQGICLVNGEWRLEAKTSSQDLPEM